MLKYWFYGCLKCYRTIDYLECVSIGVSQEMMDEDFVKDFFKTIFLEYHRSMVR